jgi:hypothetical protein
VNFGERAHRSPKVGVIMATRSRIAMKVKHGYQSICCHNDGKPLWVGRLLLKHYTSSEKIRQLIDLGNISILGEEIGEQHDMQERWSTPAKEWPSKPWYTWTDAYTRDRGDPPQDHRALHDPNLPELAMSCDDCDAEYVYVWKDGRWYFSPVSGRRLTLRPLTVYDVLGIENCPIDAEQPGIAADWLEEKDRKAEADKIRQFGWER